MAILGEGRHSVTSKYNAVNFFRRPGRLGCMGRLQRTLRSELN